MKKALLMIAVMLGSVTAFAQNLDKNELKQLKEFLSQPSAEAGKTNAEALKIHNLNAPASWEGVTIQDGHVTAIKWSDKKLAGDFSLTGFKVLSSLDVSRNSLSSIDTKGNSNLTEVNAYRNKITAANFEGNIKLQKLNIYRNRLTDIDITDTPLLSNLNISNNLIV